MPTTLTMPPTTIKIGAEIAIAPSGVKDFFPIKYFAARTLRDAVISAVSKVQTIYKIKPGLACDSEKPFSAISKKIPKTQAMPMFIIAVTRKFKICIVKIYENICP